MKNPHRVISSMFGAALIALAACEEKPPAAPPAPPAPAAAPGTALTRESLVAMLREPDDFARARHFGELLPTLGPDSLPVVKEALDDAGQLEMSAVEFELLLHYWAQHDLPGAAWYALSGSPRAFRVGAIYGAVTPWIRSDP